MTFAARMRRAGVAGLTAALGMAVGCHSTPSRSEPAAPYVPVQKRDVSSVQTPRPVEPAVNAAEHGAATQSLTGAVERAQEPMARMLKSGDRIQITIFAPPEPGTFLSVVDERGHINLPLIGTFVVEGKTCSECQRQIEKEYIDQKYYKTVTVVIVPPESEYTLTGEVEKPGSYPLTRNVTLKYALARTTYTPYADKTKVFLSRNNVRMEVRLEDIDKGKKPDPVIIPGDIIEVPRSWY